jgi:Primase C terminal 2 (PriCT-2)
MTPRLETDRAQIALFVEVLFQGATLGTWASLRSFWNDKNATGLPFWPEPVRVTPANMTPLIDRATAYATRCANHALGVVFAPPVASFKTQRKATEGELADVLALSVECDGRARRAVATLSEIIGAPTIVLASGGLWVDPETGEVEDKMHAHWRLRRAATSAEDHARAKRARRMMRDAAGSDGTAVPAVHPLRWPGSWHRKNLLHPRMARIVECDEDAIIDLDVACAALGKIAVEHGATPEREHTPNPEKMAAFERVERWMHGIPNPHPLLDQASPDYPNERFRWRTYIGMACHAATGGSKDGLRIFEEWSAKDPAYANPEIKRRVAARWAHWGKHPATQLGAGTLCYWFNEFHSVAIDSPLETSDAA